jgi:AraC family ethanolamine operon transcriptional activator
MQHNMQNRTANGASLTVPIPVRLKRLSFDEYADAVREADLNFLTIGPSHAPYGLHRCEIESIVLQFGAEGASKIVHGLSRSDALLFIVPYAEFADRVIFDGHEAKPYDFAALSPSSHFTAVTIGSIRWMSISLPIGLFRKAAAAIGKADLEWVERAKWIFSTPPESVERLIAEAANLTAFSASGARSRPEGVETSLLNLLIDAVANASKKASLSDEAARPSRRIMHKALEYVRHHKWQALYVDDLARAANVTERTLRRSFNQQLAIGPARYLKLRQLNIVRRVLRGKFDNSPSIKTIMGEHGISEFGRFAVEYKLLFGESPSDTRKRIRTRQRGTESRNEVKL